MHVNLRPERRSRLWRLLIPFALVATAIVAIGGPAQAAAPSMYSATITPNVVEEGTTNTHTFTITKVSGGGSIGSVNIVVPPQFTANLARDAHDHARVDWKRLVRNAQRQHHRAPRSPDESATVPQERPEPQPDDVADGACGCAPGSYALDVTAKESRTFSGGAIIEGNDPTITCYDQVCTARACNQTDPTTETNLQTPVPERRHAWHQLPRSSERRLRDRRKPGSHGCSSTR